MANHFSAPSVNVIGPAGGTSLAARVPRPTEGGLMNVAGRTVRPHDNTTMYNVAGAAGAPTNVVQSDEVNFITRQGLTSAPVGRDLARLMPRRGSGVAMMAPPIVQVASGSSQVARAGLSTGGAPGTGAASAGDVAALAASHQALSGTLAGILQSMAGQIATMATQIQALTTGTGQAMSLAQAAAAQINSLGQNVSTMLDAMGSQLDAQNTAIAALARGSTETFTPRNIVVPIGSPNVQVMASTDQSMGPVGVAGQLTTGGGMPNANVAGYSRRVNPNYPGRRW